MDTGLWDANLVYILTYLSYGHLKMDCMTMAKNACTHMLLKRFYI